MIIALAGPPCSGKSTVGLLLAKELGMKFTDVDSRVEAAAGLSIPEIFSQKGEAWFRMQEKEQTTKALKNDGTVIALGGGALLDRSTLEAVLKCCLVFTLTAGTDILVSRNRGGRPLAGSDRLLRELLEIRRSHYLSLPGKIDVSRLSPAETVQVLLKLIRKEAPSR